ncbi:MAG: sulfate adenylyltransferase subunit 2 [Candidatus Omnitrophica bacterium]|nr:sulfate adenylyltransferase subunit 2 [Candidatus Omnitrophota bacterium]
MHYLDELENTSIFIIREAHYKFANIAALWSIGKDSTTLLWLCRKAFFGKIPFPIIHIDTGYKFPQMYKFRDIYAEKWGLDLIVGRNEKAIEKGSSPEKGRLECCDLLKTEALKQTIAGHDLKALLLGIRRDEHGIRAKERYFSPRDDKFRWDYQNQPAELWEHYKSSLEKEGHFRVHPLLHWTELNIWQYIKREKIPVTGLYFARGGKRYRSIGCVPCCRPVDSKADTIDKIIDELKTTRIAERSGRAQDKENAYAMQKLRSLGYM